MGGCTMAAELRMGPAVGELLSSPSCGLNNHSPTLYRPLCRHLFASPTHNPLHANSTQKANGIRRHLNRRILPPRPLVIASSQRDCPQNDAAPIAPPLPPSSAESSNAAPPAGASAAQLSRRQALIAAGAAAGTGLAPAALRHRPGLTAAESVSDGEPAAIAALRERVSAFTLSNGMRWLVLERHNAPVIACHTYADVGASVEVAGQTGIAHLLEHMAFKGTARVGTTDPRREAQLLDSIDEVFYSMRDAEASGNSARVSKLRDEFARLLAAAEQLAVPNEYGSILARQGGVGLNAATSQDNTEYYVSLPANKLELWMALESGRFIAPVFRQLYNEKEVVKEERRLRVDNSPYGRFSEEFARVAFAGAPYGRPVIGYPGDLEALGRREVDAFFARHYRPDTLTCAVAGDVDPTTVQRLAEKYFGPWRPFSPDPRAAAELRAAAAIAGEWPQAQGPKEVRASLPANPFYMEGYLRPPSSSPLDPSLSVLCDVLSSGRTSRLFRRLVVPGKLLSVDAAESFPGDQMATLLLLYGIPKPGSSTEDVASLLHSELDSLLSQPLTEDELLPAKKSAKAGLLEAFGSNRAMARLLCEYEATTGSWANLLQEPDKIQAVAPNDIQAVARRLFRPDNRVAGHVSMGPFDGFSVSAPSM